MGPEQIRPDISSNRQGSSHPQPSSPSAQSPQPSQSSRDPQPPQPTVPTPQMGNTSPDKKQDKKERGSPGRGRRVLKWFSIVIIVAAVIASGVFAYLYFEARQEVEQYSDPQAAAQAETERLTQEVGELIELPADEQPTIATVVDREELQDQPFFANAQNGDRVLIYTQARKAILYRPDTKKIIEVAPINIGDQQTQSNQQEQSSTDNSTQQ